MERVSLNHVGSRSLQNQQELQRRNWIRQELASILEVSAQDIDDWIVNNIESYETPTELEHFLYSFTTGSNPEKIRAFVGGVLQQPVWQQPVSNMHGSPSGPIEQHCREQKVKDFNACQSAGSGNTLQRLQPSTGRLDPHNSCTPSRTIDAVGRTESMVGPQKDERSKTSRRSDGTPQTAAGSLKQRNVPFGTSSNQDCPQEAPSQQRRGRFGPKRNQQNSSLHRSICFCNAQTGEHQLVGNCLSCGKIVCSGEGPGPCLYCGSRIAVVGSMHLSLLENDDDGETDGDDDVLERQGGNFSKVPDAIIQRNRSGGEIHNTARRESGSKPKAREAPAAILSSRRQEQPEKQKEEVQQLQRALEQKNRLLEFERTSAQRTKVYDDSTDWFAESTNLWLTQTDRERAATKAKEIEKTKKQMNKSRQVTFDMKSGEVTLEKVNVPDDSLDAVDAFLCRVREQGQLSAVEDCSLRRKNIAVSHRVLGRASAEATGPTKSGTVEDATETLFIGPNPYLSGEAKELYETVRQRLQRSTMTDAVRRQQLAASSWGMRHQRHMDVTENSHSALRGHPAPPSPDSQRHEPHPSNGQQPQRRWQQAPLSLNAFANCDLLIAEDWKTVDGQGELLEKREDTKDSTHQSGPDVNSAANNENTHSETL